MMDKIKVLNMTDGKQLFQSSHDGNVNCVDISDNSIISCSADKTTRIWSLEDGSELNRLQHPESCNNFDLNLEEMLLAVAHDSGITLWDFAKKLKIKEIIIQLLPGNCRPDNCQFYRASVVTRCTFA